MVEAAIRWELKEPKGELTKEDLESVYELDLIDTQIIDAGESELQKALPKCKINR